MQGNGVKHGSGKRAERMDSVSSRCRCAILQKLQTATGIRQVLVPGLLLGLSLLIPALAGAEERLPLAISSHGKSYTIAAFTPGTNEKGSTTITISGSGFNTMPLRNGQIVVPVLCSFTTGGEEYGWEQVQGGDGSLTFVFDTAKKPETISFYAEDKQEKKYEFKAR